MKKFLTGVVIVITMVITILGLGSTLNAQNRFDSSLKPVFSKYNNSHESDIKVMFKVYLNNMDIETVGCIVELINLKNNHTSSISINNNFHIYLLRNEMYAIKISHIGYNTKTILINTNTGKNSDSWELSVGMYLYDNRPDEVAGVLYYDSDTDQFQVGPYKK